MIRRVLLLLTVVALMAAMMAMSAGSASAGFSPDTKQECKNAKAFLKFFGSNQGQCIKASKGGSNLAV